MARNRFSSISHHASAWMQFQGNLLPSTFLSFSYTFQSGAVQFKWSLSCRTTTSRTTTATTTRANICAPLWSFAAASAVAVALHSREENEFCSLYVWPLPCLALTHHPAPFIHCCRKGCIWRPLSAVFCMSWLWRWWDRSKNTFLSRCYYMLQRFYCLRFTEVCMCMG